MILLLKKRFIKFLKSKFIFTPIHIVATFISPRFRSHKFSDHESRKESGKLLDDLLREVPESEPENDGDVPIAINQYRNSIFDMHCSESGARSWSEKDIHLVSLPIQFYSLIEKCIKLLNYISHNFTIEKLETF